MSMTDPRTDAVIAAFDAKIRATETADHPTRKLLVNAVDMRYFADFLALAADMGWNVENRDGGDYLLLEGAFRGYRQRLNMELMEEAFREGEE